MGAGQQNKKSGGSKKYGRNKAKCERYRARHHGTDKKKTPRYRKLGYGHARREEVKGWQMDSSLLPSWLEVDLFRPRVNRMHVACELLETGMKARGAKGNELAQVGGEVCRQLREPHKTITVALGLLLGNTKTPAKVR